jgi:uncharacterized protein (DUF2384 family)
LADRGASGGPGDPGLVGLGTSLDFYGNKFYILFLEKSEPHMRPEPNQDPIPSDSSIVIKALVRAADRLDVPNKTISKIIGVSQASVSRMRKGDFVLDGKPLELAVMFVRLYRSLDAVVGGDDLVARAWLRNSNSALKKHPIDLIETVSGLTDVIQYLDARRAVV